MIHVRVERPHEGVACLHRLIVGSVEKDLIVEDLDRVKHPIAY